MQFLPEAVQLYKIKKNSLIHDFLADFFPERVLGDIPVTPYSSVAPVGLRDFGVEQPDEIHRSEVVLMPVALLRSRIVQLCGILDTSLEEIDLPVTLHLHDEPRPVFPDTPQVKSYALVGHRESRNLRRRIREVMHAAVLREQHIQ